MTRPKKNMVLGKKDDTDEKSSCGKCKKTVPNDEAVFCEGMCKSWFDLGCAMLTKEEYNYLNKLGEKVAWYCTNCNLIVSELVNMKTTSDNEDWPSTLNIVLASVQSNTSVMHDLAYRLEMVESKDRDVDSRLTACSLEIQSLKEELQSRPKQHGMDVLSMTEFPTMHDGMTNFRRSKNINTTVWDRKINTTTDVDLKKNQKEQGTSQTGKQYGPPTEIKSSNDYRLDPLKENKFAPKTDRSSRTRPIELSSMDKNHKIDSEEFQGEISSDDDEWKEVSYKKFDKSRTRSAVSNQGYDTNRRSYATESRYNSKPDPNLEVNQGYRPRRKAVYGKGTTNQELVAVARNTWIFVSRLSTSVTAENVKSFVTGLCKGASEDDIICEKLTTRYNTYNSFKVGCPIHFFDELMKGENWPMGVLVCKFIPAKSTQSRYKNEACLPDESPVLNQSTNQSN